MSKVLASSNTSSHILWFGLGICTAIACHITYRQLDTFKRRCEITTPPVRDTVDKTTEDAIKLETLAVLARGTNYSLSRASLRIIAGRALIPENFSTLLVQLQHPAHIPRIRALKVLKFLLYSKVKSDHFYENDTDYILSKNSELRVSVTHAIKAVMMGLYIAVTPPKNALPEWKKDDECEKVGLQCLRQLFAMNNTGAISAGIIDLLKKYPIEGYENVVVAFHDREYQPENYELCEIYNLLIHIDEARQFLKDAGLDPKTIERRSRGVIDEEPEELEVIDPDEDDEEAELRMLRAEMSNVPSAEDVLFMGTGRRRQGPPTLVRVNSSNFDMNMEV